jgi:hypothetical protein
LISYAPHDAVLAQEVCSALEATGFPCWMAPRNVVPATLYADGIVRGNQRVDHVRGHHEGFYVPGLSCAQRLLGTSRPRLEWRPAIRKVLSRKMLQIRYKPWKIHDDQQ